MLRVFIGHGRSQAWRDLEEHIGNRHRCRIEPYEIGSRAGHAIRDILEVEGAEDGCAILVVTGEDVALDPSSALRLGLAHEAGVFQGKLGFDSTTILLEQGDPGAAAHVQTSPGPVPKRRHERDVRPCVGCSRWNSALLS